MYTLYLHACQIGKPNVIEFSINICQHISRFKYTQSLAHLPIVTISHLALTLKSELDYALKRHNNSFVIRLVWGEVINRSGSPMLRRFRLNARFAFIVHSMKLFMAGAENNKLIGAILSRESKSGRRGVVFSIRSGMRASKWSKTKCVHFEWYLPKLISIGSANQMAGWQVHTMSTFTESHCTKRRLSFELRSAREYRTISAVVRKLHDQLAGNRHICLL